VLVRKLEEKSQRLEQANRELGATNERLRRLSRRVLEVQESERAAIARELHDGIGQVLTAIKLDAGRLAQRASGTDAERLAGIVEAVAAALEQARSIARALRPPQLDQVGLCGALRDLTERMAESAGLDARFLADDPRGAPDPAVATAAYRVAQEALTNVARHAAALSVTVELRRDDGELRIAVSDDGEGFDVEVAERQGGATGIGLLGMRERAALAGGWLSLRSAPGQGTRVEAGFPLVTAPGPQR
jgi:signal transduction histidine kinase